MEINDVRARLDRAKDTRGELARIARESGVTYRTLLNIRKGERETTAGTLGLLSAYFKKQDRRAKA